MPKITPQSLEGRKIKQDLLEQRLKKCYKCDRVLSVEHFHKHKNRKDGLATWCKECKVEDQRQPARRSQQKKWREQRDPEKKRAYYRAYKKQRRQNDVAFRLREGIGCVVRNALVRANNGAVEKGGSCLDYFPFTMNQLKEHLEGLFIEGMSWQNYGEWHIDHIKPQVLLPYKTMDEPNFLECWALENLQPLWAEDNIRKGAAI